MEIDRRTFTIGLAALLSGTSSPSYAIAARTVFAAATRNPDGTYAAVLYDLNRGLLETVVLPARGHDIAVNPITRECVAFARRPGTFAIAFGVPHSRSPIPFAAPAGRHFYGHGVFSTDGQLLYTTENNTAASTGIIGIWDATDGYRRVGELASLGVGPHDINMLSDGRTLVVANGGIITDPAHGRRPLNLASMQPNLTYVDRTSGDLIEQVTLPAQTRHRSIRHLGVGANNTVVIGCQFKGPRTRFVDLIAFHRRGEQIAWLESPSELFSAMRHYVSSVAIDRSGEIAAVTSSRGQQAAIIDISARRLLGTHAQPDISGIAAAPMPGHFITTSGTGTAARISAAKLQTTTQENWSWDNHAVAV